MKKIFLTLILAVASVAAAYAQTAREVYNSYSGQKDVSTVYISPMMFKMLGSLPDVKVEDVDLKLVAESLNEFFLINCCSSETAQKLKADSEALLRKANLDLMMEVNDGPECVRIYVREDGDCYSDFMMMETCPDEATLIIFSGQLKKESLSALINKNIE